MPNSLDPDQAQITFCQAESGSELSICRGYDQKTLRESVKGYVALFVTCLSLFSSLQRPSLIYRVLLFPDFNLRLNHK